MNGILNTHGATIPDNVVYDATTLTFNEPGCSFEVSIPEKDSYPAVLVGSASFETLDSSTMNFSCDLKEGTKINNVPHTIKAKVQVTANEHGMPINFNVLEAIFDGEPITGLSNLLNSGLNQSASPESQPEV